MIERIRIATRGSALALAQSKQVAAALEARAGVATELVVVRTTGDAVQDRPLQALGGKGLFTREVEQALLDGVADMAVHSYKDLPVDETPGLCVAAIPLRVEARDILLTCAPADLASLRSGARVATGSVRRRALLLHLRPDLDVVPLRGNVDTRLRRLRAGDFDAIVLAAAGLARLGIDPGVGAQMLDPESFVPAPAQGALALQAVAGGESARVLGCLHDDESATAVAMERAFLRAVGADCHVPVGAWAARNAAGAYRLVAVVARIDGSQVWREVAEAPAEGVEAAGAAVGARLLAAAGGTL